MMAALARGRRGPFPRGKVFVGVVHLPPLPGSPRWDGDLDGLRTRALADADALVRGGADAILIENLGDAPYAPGRVGSETVAAMAAVVEATAAGMARGGGGRGGGAPQAGVPLGVNVLRSDGPSGMAIAAATGARFIRVNVHAGAAWTDQGLIQGRADVTTRMRATLHADVRILADVRVKHAAPVAPSRPLGEEARETLERGLADGLIVTGSQTGVPVEEGELREVRLAVPDALILAGSGVREANAAALLRHADGAIVGTTLHRGERLDAPLDVTRVKAMARAIHAAG